MSESDFQHYYRKIRERDLKTEAETPLPEPSETNVWIMFGLSVGIGSAVLGIFTFYAVIPAGFALFMSIIGHLRKRTDTLGVAATACSAGSVILCIVMEAVRNMFFEDINLPSLSEFLSR